MVQVLISVKSSLNGKCLRPVTSERRRYNLGRDWYVCGTSIDSFHNVRSCHDSFRLPEKPSCSWARLMTSRNVVCAAKAARAFFLPVDSTIRLLQRHTCNLRASRRLFASDRRPLSLLNLALPGLRHRLCCLVLLLLPPIAISRVTRVRLPYASRLVSCSHVAHLD
jgi:hypothetical protein